ncbi:MAG: transglutaminase-like domain-containing protein [Candidatus Binatia bacterium]
MSAPRELAPFLRPTSFLDSDHPKIRELAERAAGTGSDVERAIRLYYAIRDGVRYDPYAMGVGAEDYRASRIVEKPAAYCTQKAILLAAGARAIGIPAALGFADVRNHLTTPKLAAVMGGNDLFVWHGYTDLFLDGRWVKATPAFNLELCERFGVHPLEFDGRTDSVFQEFDRRERRHMEYVRSRGRFEDLPLDEILADFAREYPGLSERHAAARGERDERFGHEPMGAR